MHIKSKRTPNKETAPFYFIKNKLSFLLLSVGRLLHPRAAQLPADTRQRGGGAEGGDRSPVPVVSTETRGGSEGAPGASLDLQDTGLLLLPETEEVPLDFLFVRGEMFSVEGDEEMRRTVEGQKQNQGLGLEPADITEGLVFVLQTCERLNAIVWVISFFKFNFFI